MDVAEGEVLAAFDLADEHVTDVERAFLTALRAQLPETSLPRCAGYEPNSLLLVLDLEPPEDIVLVTLGLLLTGDILQGDRISVHHHGFPPTPTSHGFTVRGTPEELAARAAQLLLHYDQRPVVLHEWLHQDRVYASCYVFADTGERLAQMYRDDWSPPGEKFDLDSRGFVRNGWVHTAGMRTPDRITHVRGRLLPIP